MLIYQYNQSVTFTDIFIAKPIEMVRLGSNKELAELASGLANLLPGSMKVRYQTVLKL